MVRSTENRALAVAAAENVYLRLKKYLLLLLLLLLVVVVVVVVVAASILFVTFVDI
jgi:hypothetical protein